jgi:hypothetical protein
VRIDPWPSRADTAGNGTPLATKCEPREYLAPFGSFSRRNSRESAKKINEAGDDTLVMGEFGNAEDSQLVW